ncbi:MAG TPA: hypothetical protein VFP50_15340 [Anaeromyxobacteraceae bacterium]|nr:hypothetical protein [Anaeromyxobacteraceae bacterium]
MSLMRHLDSMQVTQKRQARMRPRCWMIGCPLGHGHIGRHARGARVPSQVEMLQRAYQEAGPTIADNVTKNNALLALFLRRGATP